jgi:ribosomal protein S18 acetylase RimI-like enzyme
MLIRPARAGDAPLLRAALVEAFTWSGAEAGTPAEILARPDVAHYVVGWPQVSDFGAVAIDGGVAVDGEGLGVGAAWCRLLPEDDPGYGFVAPDVPELTMAVLPDYRGRGIGRALLEAVLLLARERGHPAISLSVEDGNPAQRLYESVGFVTVGRNGRSDTMRASTVDLDPSNPEVGRIRS